MKAIVSQVILMGFSSRVDGSLGFRGVTPELTSVEKVAMMELQGKNCRALFEPMDYTAEEKIMVKGEVGQMSPGERFRAILFVEYKEKRLDSTFNEYYYHEMNKLCEARKLLLPER